MIAVLQTQDFDTVEDFITAINKERRHFKDHWIWYAGKVAGKTVHLKTYNTSLQIMEVSAIKHFCPCDAKVSEWQQALRDALNYEVGK